MVRLGPCSVLVNDLFPFHLSGRGYVTQADSVLGRFIDPGAGTHVNLALNVCAFLHRKVRAMDITHEDGGLEELHFFSRGDSALDFPATINVVAVIVPLMTACSPTVRTPLV